MNGKQLKNSILQWAIQGKLVPQDPNDEPASVLLERIREEKARLVKEGKIKKDKNESIIFRGDDNSHYEKFADGTVKCIDDEIPFEIPAGWSWCKIKHICTMQAGKNISASKIFTEYSDSHPYRCVGGNGLRGYTDSYNTSGHYSIVGRQGALCGCLNIENGDFYATEHAVVVDTYGIIPTAFIYYFLTALNLNQYATATAQPGLAVSNIIEVMFPLPPIQEQQRIFEQIELIIPLVNKYEQSRSKLDSLNKTIYTQLKKSILQEAIQGKLVQQDSNDEPASVLLERIKKEKAKLFKEGKFKKKDLVDSVIFKGEDNKYYEQIGKEVLDISEDIPFEIPESWSWTRLSNICSICTGATFKKEDATQNQSGVRILRGGNILPFRIFIKDDDIFIPRNAVKDNILLRQNDIVTPAVTSLENIGKMARIESDMPTATVGGFVFILRPYLNDAILSEYLLSAMSAPATVEFIRSITNKSGQAFYNIGKERLSTTLIPVPSHEEQRHITRHIQHLFSKLR